MAKRKDYLVEGKYGLPASAEQVNTAINNLMFYLDYFDPRKAASFQNWRGSIGDDFRQNKDSNTKKEFAQTFKDKKTAEKHSKKVKEMQKTVRDIIQKKGPRHKRLWGYIELSEKMMDTEAGDFGAAMKDNAYLSLLCNMYINGPKVPQGKTFEEAMSALDDLDPVTGKHRGPLNTLNRFMSTTARLIDMEYERQKIEKDYTPEKEKAYLDKLDVLFTRLLNCHKKFDAMVPEDGKSKYNPYLQQTLDTMTYKNKTDTHSRRSAMFAIKNIEGQKKAIENGWGMNELNLLGSLSEFKYTLDIQKNILKEECNPELWENRKNTISQKISSQQALVEQNRRDLEEAKALNNKTQDEISRMESYLRNSERQLENYRRDYNKLGTREEDTRKKYNELNAISQKIDKVYDDAMNKDIVLDKIGIADEYEKVLKEVGKIAVADKTSNAGKSVETVQKKAEEGLLAVKNSMEYAGRKPVPVSVLEDHVLPEKELSDYNALFCLKSATSVDMNLVQGLDKLGKNYLLSVTNPYRNYLESEDHFYNITDHNNFITGPLKTPYLAPLIRYKLPEDKAEREEVIKLGEDTLRQLEALFCEKMSKDTSDEKELRRYTASLAELADIEKGELLTAMIDQPILVNVLAQAGCGINMYKDGAEKVTKQWMQERNLLEPYLAFCDAGKELTSAEYEKQHMKKNGWDAKKEKQYLARLDECYDKMIKGFEACFDAPQEAQNEKGIIANSFGEMTGNTYNDGIRPITAEITGLKWMREGIKQGWDSKDLQCLFFMGTVEGYIEGSITTSLRKAENLAGNKDKEQEEKDWRAKAVILQEFKDKELKPFKESLLGMKIKSPQDKLKAVTMIQGFYEKYKNYPILKSDDEVNLDPLTSKVSVFAYLESANNTFLPRIVNRCIEEIKEAKAKGQSLEKDNTKAFEHEDRSKDMKEILHVLRNQGEMSNDMREFYASNYIMNKFFDGMNKDAHPEFFDKKHPDYAVSKKKLNDYIMEYTEHLFKAVGPQNNKEVADMIEFAGHEGVFAEIRDKVRADAAKGRLEAFKLGRPERNKNDKGMEEAIANMEKATVIIKNSDGLYDDIAKDLKALEKEKKKMYDELMNKYKTAKVPRKVVGYEKKYDPVQKKQVDDKDNPIYKFGVPEDVSLDRNRIKKFIKKEKETFEKINKYLNRKNRIIINNGKDPAKIEDVSVLGKRGEKRYKAMLDAKRALLNQNKALLEFGNHGPTSSERFLADQPTLFPENLNMAQEKERLQNNIRYGIANADRNCERMIGRVLSAEAKKVSGKAEEIRDIEQNRFFLKREYDYKLQNNRPEDADAMRSIDDKLKLIDAKKKSAEDGLVESAEHMFFAQTVKNLYGKNRNEIYLAKTGADRKAKADEWKAQEKAFDDKKREYDRLAKQNHDLGREVPEKDKNDFTKAEQDFAKQKKAYEDSIKAIDKTEKNIALGYDPKNIVDRLSIDQLKNVNAGYAGAVNDFIKNGKDGFEFKKDSAQFTEFKQNILEKEPFKTEFRKRVLDESGKKALENEDIMNICDGIIKDSAAKNHNKPEELTKLTELRNSLGLKHDNAAKDVHQPAAKPDEVKKAPEKKVLK